MLEPHSSGRDYPESIQFYIDTELGHEALLEPFKGKLVKPFHCSPLMSSPKKDS